MNIAWAIPCRYVEVHDNLATIIGAGIDTVWIEELPAMVGCMVAVRLVGMPDEFTPDQKRPTSTRIKSPSGATISEVQGSFALGIESARPEYLVGATLPVAIQFPVTEEGTYAVEFEFGDVWESLPIHVVLGQPSS